MPPVTFTQYVWTWCATRAGADPFLVGAHMLMPHLRDAFDVGLDKPPHPQPDLTGWMADRIQELDVPDAFRTENWHVHLHALALHLADAANAGGNPFGGYMEAPPVIIAAYERYHRVLVPEHRTERAAAFALLLDVLALLYPEAADQVH